MEGAIPTLTVAELSPGGLTLRTYIIPLEGETGEKAEMPTRSPRHTGRELQLFHVPERLRVD